MKYKSLLFILVALTGCGAINNSLVSSSNEVSNGEDVSSFESIKEESSSSENVISSESYVSSENSVSSEVISYKEPSYSYEDFFTPENSIKFSIRLTNKIAFDLCYYGSPDRLETQDIYHPCDVVITFNDETIYYPECGLRLKGNTSRVQGQYCFDENGYINGEANFKLSFNETFEDHPYYVPVNDIATLKARRYLGMKKLDFKWNKNKDQYFTKEAYASYIMAQEGLMSQKINLIEMELVTEKENKSFVYQALEVIDEDFIKRYFSKNEAKGDLYKCGWVNGNNLSLNNTDSYLMGVEDKSKGKLFVYDLKTNKKKSTHASLINLINSLMEDDYSKDEDYLYNKLDNLIDIEYFAKFLAFEWIIANPDSMRYNYNNTYLYFNSENNKLYPIMYDNDRVFGILQDWEVMPTRWPSTTKDISGNVNSNPLYLRTVCNGSNAYPMSERFLTKYIDYIYDFILKYLDSDSYYAYSGRFHTRDNAYSYVNLSFEEAESIMKETFRDYLYQNSSIDF